MLKMRSMESDVKAKMMPGVYVFSLYIVYTLI